MIESGLTDDHPPRHPHRRVPPHGAVPDGDPLVERALVALDVALVEDVEGFVAVCFDGGGGPVGPGGAVDCGGGGSGEGEEGDEGGGGRGGDVVCHAGV